MLKENTLYQLNSDQYGILIPKKKENPNAVTPPTGDPNLIRPYHNAQCISGSTLSNKIDYNAIRTHNLTVSDVSYPQKYHYDCFTVTKSGSNVKLEYCTYDDDYTSPTPDTIFNSSWSNKITTGPLSITYDPSSSNGGCNGLDIYINGSGYFAYFGIYLDWLPGGVTKGIILFQDPPRASSTTWNFRVSEYRVNTNPIF